MDMPKLDMDMEAFSSMGAALSTYPPIYPSPPPNPPPSSVQPSHQLHRGLTTPLAQPGCETTPRLNPLRSRPSQATTKRPPTGRRPL